MITKHKKGKKRQILQTYNNKKNQNKTIQNIPLCLLYTGQSPGPSSLHKTIFTVLYSMTIFVAVVGNLLLIFIIKRRHETRSLTGFLFVNMAVADLLVALIAMPVSLHILHGGGVWATGMFGNVTCSLTFFTFHVTLGASILSLLIMSVDRYFAVARPLHRFETFRKARVLTVFIWLSAMIFSIPAAIIWRLVHWPQIEGLVCGPKYEELGKFGTKGFYTYLVLIMYLIPLIIIITLYSRICLTLWHRSMPGEASSEIEKRNEITKRRVVRMLVIITAVFALCWFPAHFYHLLIAYRPDVDRKLPYYVMILCFWLGHANSAVNPWLYMMLNEKFRIALSATVRGRDPRMRSGSNRTQSTSKYTSIEGGNSFKTRQSNREKSKAETFM